MLDHPPVPTDPDEPEWFDFEGHALRLTWINGSPHWILDEICVAIGISNPRFWAQQLEHDETLLYPIESDRGPYEELLLTEPGLYNLLRRSRTPAGRRLDRWVNHEVLPSLRRGDLVPRAHSIPQTWAEALQVAADEAKAREVAERRVAELTPRAEIADHFIALNAEHLVTIEDWAKTLSPPMTGIEAMAKLRELGVISKRRNTLRGRLHGREVNLPNEPYASQGYFRVTDDEVSRGLWTKVTRLTPEGQIWLRGIFISYGWTSR